MFEKNEYVYAVYREESFTRAAKKLYISQPSLSAYIRKIEDEIGAPIFERGAISVRPTEIGREYIATVERMLRAKEEFCRRLDDINSLEVGELRVGTSNHIISHYMPQIIGAFTRAHPKIEIAVTEASSVELYRLTGSEELDLIIDSLFADENYSTFPLVHENILLAVPRGFAVNGGLELYRITKSALLDPGFDLHAVPALPISTFGGEKFILLKSGNDMNRRADRIFREGGIEPQVSFYVDQLLTSYTWCVAGMGACFVPDSLIKHCEFGDETVFYRVREENDGRSLCIACLKGKYLTAAMRAFIATAQETVFY